MSKLHRKQDKQSKQNHQHQPPTLSASTLSAVVDPEPIDQSDQSDQLDPEDLYDEDDEVEEALNALEQLEATEHRGEVGDEPVVEPEAAHTDPLVSTPSASLAPTVSDDAPPPASNKPTFYHPIVVTNNVAEPLPEIAVRAARAAVEKVLADQSESRLFDVFDNRTTITLPADDLALYEAQWREQNAVPNADRVSFSTFITRRLHLCRAHTASRAIYVGDVVRMLMEELFGDVIYSEHDLMNKIDRHLRPIIESPDNPTNILRLKPLDPLVVELVPSWYPDKTPTEAISDFVNDAVREKAGLA